MWQPAKDLLNHSRMVAFMRSVNQRHGMHLHDFDGLYQWSVEQPAQFWEAIVAFLDIPLSQDPECVLDDSRGMFDAKWFTGAKLNIVNSLLAHKHHNPALISCNENGEIQRLSGLELYQQVARFSHALRQHGITSGDRVAAILPNISEAIIAMLACASIGAIWSCCSPEFGRQAILDRFRQITPRVLIFSDGYQYRGKRYNRLSLMHQLIQSIDSVELSIRVPYLGVEDSMQTPEFASFLETTDTQLDCDELDFNHPLYILYSSGTTGIPKCIVHGAGGTLIQHLKELMLHVNLGTNDTLFYYTSTGWMMWNWMVSGLASGATLVLYDGSPLYPEYDSLLKLVCELDVSVFGCSARYISLLNKHQVKLPALQQSRLRTILSTGSPLLPESYDYVYQTLHPKVQLCSISGGTDIVSCFALGNPMQPVHRGELQGPGLGMAIQVFDEDGHSVTQQKGELVCDRAFPSMPVGFWNDSDRRAYHAAYFERFPDVWTHGDYAEITDNHGVIIYGRSDATLNPGGIRIGTAEIYRQLENFSDIEESLVVAQTTDDDQRILLFIQLASGVKFTDTLCKSIRQQIRQNASIHHVPDVIYAVTDLPRTYSGKLAELAVTHQLHGRQVSNIAALVNPDCLAQFSQLEALEHG